MMGLLRWLVEAIVLFLIVRTVIRLLTGRTTAAASRRTAEKLERSGGTLVRDPQCGIYVPQSRAVRSSGGADTLYFCSAECRDAYAARSMESEAGRAAHAKPR